MSGRPLASWEERVLVAFAERVFRAEGGGFPPLERTAFRPRIRALVAQIREPDRTDLTRLLFALEWALPAGAGRPGRFSRLSGDARDAVLAQLEAHPVRRLRGAFETLKALVAMGYFADDSTWGALGYDGPRDDRPALVALGRDGRAGG